MFDPVWERDARATTATSASSSTRCSKTPPARCRAAERTTKYIELGKKWSAGHKNRMIKVPATPGGLGALEELVAAGVTLNVTLIFSERQYNARPRRLLARHPAARRPRHASSRSTASSSAGSTCTPRSTCRTCRRPPRAGRHRQRQAHLEAEPASSGRTRGCRCKQEMIFASTGTKKPDDPPWKYVEAFAGSDIETNPPAHERGGAEERPDVHPPASTRCRPPACSPRSTRRWT